MTEYLSKELESPLTDVVEGAGQGSSDGSTRTRVTDYLENTRAKVFCRALELHPDQSARPVWANPQMDTLSTGWLQQLPGPEGLTQVEFSETMARFLCLPSPSCAPKVGEPLHQRGLTIDIFGDNVLSVTNLPGGNFTRRHDGVKLAISQIILDSSLRADCEVLGVFKDIIPVGVMEAQAEERRQGRAQNGLVPDFKLQIPGPQAVAAGVGTRGQGGEVGVITNSLAELKVIGAVTSYYPRSGPSARRKKGVEKRARDLPGEYRRPLASLDQQHYHTRPGEAGPLVRRLDSFGRLLCWVQGAWLEGSKDLHWLLELAADTKVVAMGLAKGEGATEMERGRILSGYRRKLSVAGAKAQADCLVGRLDQIGPASRAAAKRREWARRDQGRMEENRRAHWRAQLQGRSVFRGEFPK